MILGLTPLALALIMLATLASAFVRGLAGFGMAILLVPVLGLVIPPGEAVAIAAILGLLIGFSRLREVMATSERSAWIICALAMLATPAGMAVLAATTPDHARLAIAVIALVAFLLVLVPPRLAAPAGTGETALTGVATGLLTGFAGMPGLPLVPFYLGRAIAPAVARASMMLVFFATSAAGCVSAALLDVAQLRTVWLALALMPAVMLGNWLGAKAFGRVSATAWRIFAAAVLGASALGALIKLLQG